MIDVKKFLLRTRVTVPEGYRGIALVNGQLKSILRPGRHWFASLGTDVKVESFDLSQPYLNGSYAQLLLKHYPALAAEHLTVAETGAAEVALLLRDGKFYAAMKPDARQAMWTDAGPWAIEKYDVSQSLDLDPVLDRRIGASPSATLLRRAAVEEGQLGLLYIDGAFTRTLAPGAHAFWNIGRAVVVKVVDTRQLALDVPGQEILTRDKVSVRVNLAATYRVTDPVKAVAAVKDFADALYRALQHAFRQSLATKTLDDLLSRKGEVDHEAAAAVRKEMAAIGVEVGDIAIKDVILPGDMRDILNKVVAAEKEAEAQVIRRREETNATRSLLNTAKVMAENPVMLRLKELEALEKIAGNVQALTVHNGTRGLLEDLVSLKPAVSAPKRK